MPWYDVAVVSFDQAPLRVTGGVRVHPTHSVRMLAKAGTIVIPNWPRLDETPPRAMLDALRAAYARGARSTPRRAAQRASIWDCTSCGKTTGRPSPIRWRTAWWWRRTARAANRSLWPPPWRRPTDRLDRSWSGLLRGSIRRSRSSTSRAKAACRCARSRACSRRRPAPRRISGSRTSALLEAQRVLETSAASIDRVADLSGFATPETLRFHFRQRVGTSPAAYRRRFAQSA